MMRTAPATTRSWLVIVAWATLVLVTEVTAARNRPSHVNERIKLPRNGATSGNGHAMSFDGRFVIKRQEETWKAYALRPDAIQFDKEGRPKFDQFFSQGIAHQVQRGENALALCLPSMEQHYALNSENDAVYESFIFDSMMEKNERNCDGNVFFYQFRRRNVTLTISDPFTNRAEISRFDVGLEFDQFSQLRSVDGEPIFGIEPTMTSDGRLMVFQGHPDNPGKIGYLMYTYNPYPCSTEGWSKPLPLHKMNTDPNPDLKENYPLAWNPLKSPSGEEYAEQTPLRGAYPWIDPDGRFVLFTAVKSNPDNRGERREAVSLLGADTLWTLYNIDGGINESRWQYEKLFFSSPMWMYEQERHLTLNGIQKRKKNPILPVTHNHDVLPVFGTNSQDYSEVDIGDVTDRYHILSLPMNELITIDGQYDLKRTPDLSGYHSTGEMLGGAFTTPDNSLARSKSGFLNETHAKGRVLVLDGRSGLRSKLSHPILQRDGVFGFSFQLYIHPSKGVSRGCGAKGPRHILYIPSTLSLTYIPSRDAIGLKIKIDDQWISLASQFIPTNQWTHLAYSWDGVSGEIRAYLNGIRTTTTIAFGAMDFAAREILIGTNISMNEAWLRPPCTGFSGLLDEVRLYAHARSGRSICLSNYGSSCINSAMRDVPTLGHYVLSSQDPGCDDPSSAVSLSCQRASHRVCAQVGTRHALSSASNLWKTIQQMAGFRPPVSMAGVITNVDSNNNTATISCVPMPQESVAVTFGELKRFHSSCIHEQRTHWTECLSASHRFCQSIGWDTGVIFEATTRAWVTCFQTDRIFNFSDSSGMGCGQGQQNTNECHFQINTFCQEKGYDAGMIQELLENNTFEVHCFLASSTEEYHFQPPINITS